MNLSSFARYIKLSQPSRDVAYLIHKRNEVTYEELKERFGERQTVECLSELLSRPNSFVDFDYKRHTFQPSENLEFAINTLRKFI